MFILCALIAAASAIAYWFWSRPKNVPPGPPILPIVGSLPFVDMQLHLDFMDKQKQYGDTFSWVYGGKLAVVLNNYDTMKKVLGEEAASGRAQDLIGLEPQTKDGLVHGILFSQNGLWKEHRRFALSTLRDFGMGKSWLEEAVLDEVNEVCDEISQRQGQAFNPKVLFSCGVANVIGALIYGQRFSHDDVQFNQHAVKDSERIRDLETVYALQAFPWLKRIWTPMHKVLNRVNAEHLEFMQFLTELVDKHEQSADPSRSFIGAYNKEASRQTADGQSSSSFTRFQLISTLADLFAAGSETTSTTLLWAVLYMTENTKVMQKVQQEVRGRVAKDEPVRMSDRALLPYTEAMLMEVQRLASLLPVSISHTTLADMTIDGYHVPRDTVIMPNIYFAHRDPRYWQNPEQFDPTRFLDKEGKVFRPDGFMPFCVGKRACLGESLAKMELWLYFANIMHRFDFHLAPDCSTTSSNFKFAMVINPQPYKVVFEPRN